MSNIDICDKYTQEQQALAAMLRNMTNEELVNYTESRAYSTPLENELADRLEEEL